MDAIARSGPKKFREIMSVGFYAVSAAKAMPDYPGIVTAAIYYFPFYNIHKYQNSACFLKNQGRYY
jgi:hypothetical protein